MPDRPERRSTARMLGIGFELAAALIGGCLLGAWVDRKYATAPWGVLIGALIGIIAGFYNFFRASLGALRSARGEASPADGTRRPGEGGKAD